MRRERVETMCAAVFMFVFCVIIAVVAIIVAGIYSFGWFLA